MSAERCSPEPSRECCSIFFTMESARLPCWTTFSRLLFSIRVISSISSRLPLPTLISERTSFISSISSAHSAEKLLTRILDLVCNARGELPERRQFLSLNEAILRGAQVVERLRQLSSPVLNLLEQIDIRYGNYRLVGKYLDRLNLARRKRN